MNSEIIVVGAGLVGLYTSKLLGHLGHKVLILEKDPRLLPKITGNLIFPHSWNQFPFLTPFISSYSYTIQYTAKNLTDHLTIRNKTPLAAYIDFHQVELELFSSLEPNYTKINFSEYVNAISFEDKQICVKTDNNHYTTSFLIGADSTNSIVAQSINVLPIEASETFRLIAIKELKFSKKELDEIYGEARTLHYFIHFQNCCHFAWIFPGKEKITIGIYTDFIDFSRIRQFLINFEDFLIKDKKLPANNPDNASNDPLSIQIGIVPKRPPYKYSKKNSHLCGLAGNYFSPFSLEGSFYSLASASSVAKSIDGSLKARSDYSYTLDLFNQHFTQIVGKELEFQGKIFDFLFNHPIRWQNVLRWSANSPEIAHTFKKIIQSDPSTLNHTSRLIFSYFRLHHRENKKST